MNIEKIFIEMEARAKVLELNANAKIEGNCEENRYVYDIEQREDMGKELKII